MRLLRIDSPLDDEPLFSLVQYYRNIPPYAILSHTWLPEHEEVTLQDIVNKTYNDKPGYLKLFFCARRALRDGIGYIWIDTCCIDKTSSAELSEAINSMFRWYRRSVKCYVYLTDLLISDYERDSRFFQASRWFTRGWTLQELIAPTYVEFFTLDMCCIGTRVSLSTLIIETTAIPNEALRGYPMHFFSPAQRLCWAENRSTTREEDSAYSMLGIFDVHMPLIYGEGESRALSRLLHEADIYENREHGRAFKFLRNVLPSPVMYQLEPYRRFGGRLSQLLYSIVFLAVVNIKGTGPRVMDVVGQYAEFTVGDLVVWIMTYISFPYHLRRLLEIPAVAQAAIQRSKRTEWMTSFRVVENAPKEKKD